MIKEIKQKLVSLGYPDAKVELSVDLSKGDLTTNAAMQYAGAKSTSPHELASKIVAQLGELPGIDRVEVAGPGFINFWYQPDFIINKLTRHSDQSVALDRYHDQVVVVEHSSPNLFKPFHIGHMLNNVIGEAIARLYRQTHAKVIAVSYPSDVSLGIGKAVYAMLEDGVDHFESLMTLEDRLEYLGQCYVIGTKEFDDNTEVQERVRVITSKLYNRIEGPEYNAYQLGKDTTLDYFKNITARIGSEFNSLIFESEAAKVGEVMVRDNVPNVFSASDGAIIYKGENDGLHTRVFINSAGYPTYEAKDLGLLKIKADNFNPDQSIIVTDAEQKEYFKVMLAAAEKIDPALSDVTTHVPHGRMTFKGQKMSSRLGGIPTAESVLNSLRVEISERSEKDLSDYDLDAIAIAALKFSILKSSPGSNINFDPETSLSFEGDSGPYLQYSVVRISSIKSKAQEHNLIPELLSLKEEDLELIRYLTRFETVLEQSIDELAPQILLHFLLELAQLFNSYYAKNQVINLSDLAITSHRLAVIEMVEWVLRQGLSTLGIPIPSRM